MFTVTEVGPGGYVTNRFMPHGVVVTSIVTIFFSVANSKCYLNQGLSQSFALAFPFLLPSPFSILYSSNLPSLAFEQVPSPYYVIHLVYLSWHFFSVVTLLLPRDTTSPLCLLTLYGSKEYGASNSKNIEEYGCFDLANMRMCFDLEEYGWFDSGSLI
ncbi:hypothetical protein RJT34_09869 [Clitoria ternatea]|uniref:Uncharacterized protein n=1 Tax=Clitoria ternatea TaxID=43366 RepID=A0AAN9PWN1_CLITE